MDIETDFKPLMKSLGHRFKNESLLHQALTHGSLIKGKGKKKRLADYERLEFLGDRVLGILIAEELYKRYKDAEAGQLSRRFNAQVQKSTLADIAKQIDLHKYVLISEELRASGGANNPSLLEDCIEALIAALYLDGGLKAAKTFVVKYWWPRFDAEHAARKDPKSALQEWAAKGGRGVPSYVVVEEKGPDHDPEFTVEVSVEGCKSQTATGPSKRQAEKLAAKLMLKEVSNG
ncbi:ribonuclease III [Sneathiella glossodoripedis]|uniref:ribonuclease III n=1 Tax=Sneathiella glossodoripedis TaxID=418853 RepID=UPI00046E9737|nr:ribonuclease III [Sneathiella glossodoripedis]